MSVGAAGALNCALYTLINPGDGVAVFAPYFTEYANYIRNFGGEIQTVPANPPSFQPDADALERTITHRTKAVIINTPNNPTGVIYSEESLKTVASVLRLKSAQYGHPIWLISDEPYRELVYDGNTVPWIPRFYKNTIVVYSWSKSLSLPGERIGYSAVLPNCDDYDKIRVALAISTRVLGFVNAPALIQRVVERVIDDAPDISEYAERRDLLYKGLTEHGYECVYPEGAFYLWVKAPGGDDKAFCAKAKEKNILIVPGSSFGGAGYVRIAYCVSTSTISRALPAFGELI